MKKRWFGVTGCLLLLAAVAGWCDDRVLVIDDFEKGLRSQWEEKAFKGRTDYTVVPGDGGMVLQAESRAAASGLIFKHEYDLKQYPILAWRWKISNILAKGDAHTKAGDDYAARIYVIFPNWLPWNTRSINYIWANRLPQGEFIPNSFYHKAVMLAVESGPEKVGEWVAEQRNVLEDFRKIFGEDPPLAGGIAIMTDTDNTGESAVAWYDDIRLESVSR